jgi:hypothetical protein
LGVIREECIIPKLPIKIEVYVSNLVLGFKKSQNLIDL